MAIKIAALRHADRRAAKGIQDKPIVGHGRRKVKMSIQISISPPMEVCGSGVVRINQEAAQIVNRLIATYRVPAKEIVSKIIIEADRQGLDVVLKGDE